MRHDIGQAEVQLLEFCDRVINAACLVPFGATVSVTWLVLVIKFNTFLQEYLRPTKRSNLAMLYDDQVSSI